MPHGRVFEFDDPYNLQATLRAGNYEVLPLGKGPFHAELTRVDFEHLWLQRCETSANVLLHTANDPARAPMTFLAVPDQGLLAAKRRRTASGWNCRLSSRSRQSPLVTRGEHVGKHVAYAGRSCRVWGGDRWPRNYCSTRNLYCATGASAPGPLAVAPRGRVPFGQEQPGSPDLPGDRKVPRRRPHSYDGRLPYRWATGSGRAPARSEGRG